MAEPRARQDHSGETGIFDMKRNARRYEHGLPRRDRQAVVEAGAQVDTGRPVSRMSGQRKFAPDARIENPKLNLPAQG
jgi:hypothetical protein